jgi:mannose-6-phosphate isomerase-like protein (cupin superfamily)
VTAALEHVAERHLVHLAIVADPAPWPAGHHAPMNAPVRLADALATFDERWSPRVVGWLNDYKLMVVKVQGEFVWHRHEDTDDLFLVLRGQLTIQLRDRDVVLGPGDLYVVPRGVEHCPRADEEAHVLLIEPGGTVNTGDAAAGPLTAPERPL